MEHPVGPHFHQRAHALSDLTGQRGAAARSGRPDLFARPVLGLFLMVVTVAKRLQSGRLDAYLLYMLIALVAVIAVATALA